MYLYPSFSLSDAVQVGRARVINLFSLLSQQNLKELE
jgi:hypothetical protein